MNTDMLQWLVVGLTGFIMIFFLLGTIYLSAIVWCWTRLIQDSGGHEHHYGVLALIIISFLLWFAIGYMLKEYGWIFFEGVNAIINP